MTASVVPFTPRAESARAGTCPGGKLAAAGAFSSQTALPPPEGGSGPEGSLLPALRAIPLTTARRAFVEDYADWSDEQRQLAAEVLAMRGDHLDVDLARKWCANPLALRPHPPAPERAGIGSPAVVAVFGLPLIALMIIGALL